MEVDLILGSKLTKPATQAGCYDNGVPTSADHTVLCEAQGATKAACDTAGKMWLSVSRKCSGLPYHPQHNVPEEDGVVTQAGCYDNGVPTSADHTVLCEAQGAAKVMLHDGRASDVIARFVTAIL